MKHQQASRALIASVNHAADNLGLYRAELARILGLMCADVSDISRLESILKARAECQLRAEQFVLFYDFLDKTHSSDAVLMLNWFRRHNNELGTTPFLALVDEGRLVETITLLKHSADTIDIGTE